MSWRKGTATNFIDFITKVKTFATKEMFAGTVTPDVGNTGDGIVYGASGTENSVAETWTLVCTTGGGNGTAVFSVTGSVSGAKAAATAGTPYSIAEVSFTILSGGTDFEVGDEFSFDVAAGDAKYETVRERDTNDYLKSIEWRELSTEPCIFNKSETNNNVTGVAGSVRAATNALQNDFSVSLWLFNTQEYGPYGGTTGNEYNNMGTLVWSATTADGGAIIALRIVPQTSASAGKFQIASVASLPSGSFSFSTQSTSVSALSSWQHVCVTYDKAGTTLKMYINGTLESTATASLPSAVSFFGTASRPLYQSFFRAGSAVIGYRDIQIYSKVLSDAEVTDIYGSTPADDLVHHWLCDEGEGSRYAVDSVGGASYNFDLGPTKRELILKGEGSNGTAEIYTGLQSFTNAVDRWNVKLSGFTGFVGSNTFDTQPGATTNPPAMLLQNTAFNYLIHTTPNRIFLFAQAGGNDESGYMGWYIPYFSEDQWGYPIAVGGSATAASLAPSDTSTSHKAWFSLSNALQILVNGAWAAVNTADPYSVNGFAGTNHLQDAAGNYPDFDFIPFSVASSIYFGPFEGVRIPVQANTIQSGDVLVDTTAAKLVVGDTFRVGQGAVAAIDLSGD
jgi:hypothetical protein